jgi:hypothetical protein
MKKCSYCGKAYPDTEILCPFDQEPLQPDVPPPRSEPEANDADSAGTPVEAGEETDAPEGFRSLAKLDPFEASRLLKRFETDGIRFLIDRIENKVETARGYRKIGLIDIFVHQEDYDKASQMLSEDWKV